MHKKRPILIEWKEGRICVTARVRFSGWKKAAVRNVPMRESVLSELRRQFSAENPYFASLVGNALDFPEWEGRPIEVSFTLTEADRRPWVNFFLVPRLGVSCAAFFPLWRPWGSKKIFLFAGDIRTRYHYTPRQVGLVACHEFGHAMGLGDLYGGLAPYGLCYRPPAALTAEMPFNDLMRTSFRQEWFTPNDLEMALFAQRECAPQTHVPTGWWWKGLRKVSGAVRGKNVDPEEARCDRQRKRESRKRRRRDRLARWFPFAGRRKS